MGWYGNGAVEIFYVLLMVLFWGGLIGLAVWAVARLTRSGPPSPPGETARQILDRRLASGEIDAEAYATARHLIEGRGASGSAPGA